MTGVNPITLPLKTYTAQHVQLVSTGAVATITRAAPQPIIAAVDGVCAGGGRDHSHGL